MKDFFKKYKAVLILVIAMLIALTNFLVYPTFIKKDLGLVDVPVVKETLSQGQMITEDMLTTVTTSSEYLPQGIITDKTKLVGKYVKVGYTIPANGFVYSEQISTEKKAMGSIFGSLEENEDAYTIRIDNRFNKSDKLKTGQLIDLYFYTTIESSNTVKYVIGKFTDNARIIGLEEEEKYSYVTIAIKEEEVAYYLLAEQVGYFLPILTYEANGQTISTTEVYDVQTTRAFVKANNTILSKSNLNINDTEAIYGSR